MVMYDIVLETGDKVTVIAKDITHALDLAEYYYESTALDCRFVRHLDTLIIQDMR